METRLYAPVIIPTLNRYKHFTHCLESLEQCAGAEHTEVFVALDYPPSEKYIAGWKKIDAYLHEKENAHGFKTLKVFRRKENYFFSGKGNLSTAVKEVLKVYDRYIASEDDNVFAHRFLDFINAGLEKYKDDERVFAICGYCHPYGFNPSHYSGNSVMLQEMSAWGYGTWANRRYTKEEKLKMIDEYVADPLLKKHFQQRRPDIFTGLLFMKSHQTVWGDCLYTANLFQTRRYCVFPLLSLVQNHGWDGSGTHGGKLDGFSTQPIESFIAEPFNMKLVNDAERKEIDQWVVHYWKKKTSLIHRILNPIEISIYSCTGKIVTFDRLSQKAKKLRAWWYSRSDKKSIDVLLLARPDHALQIYNSLEAQQTISYHFVTFRVLKGWMKYLHIPKVAYVNYHATILKQLSLRHILKYKLGWLRKVDERGLFEKGTSKILCKLSPRIIHYWPSYCCDVVRQYKKGNPKVITIAEQYMPNPIYVLGIMKPVYEKYGLQYSNSYLNTYSKSILNHFDGADYIAVPSAFVEETMKLTFPHHQYLRIPYGVTISPDYAFLPKKDAVRKFVYVGGISLEKGVDTILSYFSCHSELELHLFGAMNNAQREVFKHYGQYQNITFYGAVSKAILRAQFKKMDVGIHPSRFDAYSLAVGEEIGSGLPVVISDNTGNKDDVLSNGWGVVYKTDDADALDKAIESICSLYNYNKFQKNIDHYIKSSSRADYGNAVVSMYRNILNA